MQTKSTKYNAMEQCRAVLSVWNEARKPGDVCRELGISGSLLTQWQEKAMAGMLEALTPREGLADTERGTALRPRLRQLLDRQAGVAQPLPRLAKRLAKLAPAPAPEK